MNDNKGELVAKMSFKLPCGFTLYIKSISTNLSSGGYKIFTHGGHFFMNEK
jgi:hypothetical protein